MCGVLRRQRFNYMIYHSIQVASSALGLGPQVAMQVAERLYIQGFIRSGIAQHLYHFLYFWYSL